MMGLQLIIPTLWRPAALVSTLTRTLNCTMVDRLVLVDNAPEQQPAAAKAVLQHPKLLWLPQPSNLYVNQAWNLGMEQIADADTVVAILNDDIEIPDAVFKALRAEWNSRAPNDSVVIGLLPPPEAATACALEPVHYQPQQSIGVQCRGFGSALFLRRRHFQFIPPQLRIWFGDDWILRQARLVLGLRSSLIRRDHHVTMKAMRASQQFREVLAQDRRAAVSLLGLGS